MDAGRVRHPDCQADPEPGAACHGVSQAVCEAAPPRPERARTGGLQKNFPALLEEIADREAKGARIEIWFQTRRASAKRTRSPAGGPSAAARPSRTARPADPLGLASFGAICPREGKAAGLVLPRCNSKAMSLHLAEISLAIKKGAARYPHPWTRPAGTHRTRTSRCLDNITLLHAAAEITRTQPGREHLAVPARQPAIQPRLPLL